MRHPLRFWIPVTAAAVLGIALSGCTEAAEAPVITGGAPDPQPTVEQPVVEPPAVHVDRTPETGFIAHEWGTFTSVQASDGTTLDGLHHEDEPLPDFVYGRGLVALGLPVPGKDMESIPEQVTQKMETPVIYFHTREELDVSVTVDFPEGIISQWFPDASTFEPGLYEIDALAGGSMTWSVDLLPGMDDDALQWVHEDDIWAPSRHVDAAGVRYAGQSERFIFYRGLGRFTLPFTITDEGGRLRVANGSDQAIPDVFVLRFDGDEGSVTRVGSVPAHGSVEADTPEATLPVDAYLAEARAKLREALVASGLYEDEAQAMVDTWTASYFRTPGLRALYVVPRAWTSALLPIRFAPEPVELVRTMVGRVEILTADDEKATIELLGKLHAANALALPPPSVNDGWSVPVEMLATLEEHFGRFAEPRIRRARQQLPAGELRDWVDAVIASVALRTDVRMPAEQ